MDHLTTDQLRQYAARQLRVRDLLSADQHLHDCADCRAQLAEFGQADAAALIARVRRARPRRAAHLSYEQLEALVDQRLAGADRDSAQAHLAACALCSNELAQLSSVAADLARPLPQASRTVVPAEKSPFWRRLTDWLGAPQAMAGAAALAVAVIAGVLIAPWGGQLGGQGTGANSSAQITQEGSAPLTLQPGEFDSSALEAIRAQGGTAGEAIARGDHAAAAAALRVRADLGDVTAQSALAWLSLNGLGVPRDVQAAQRWWTQAAEAKLSDAADQAGARRTAAIAAHNLGVLHARGLLGTADAAQAQAWYKRSAEIAAARP